MFFRFCVLLGIGFFLLVVNTLSAVFGAPSPGSAVDRAYVEERVELQARARSAACPEQPTFSVGSSVVCTALVGGARTDVRVTVTAVDLANDDVTLEVVRVR